MSPSNSMTWGNAPIGLVAALLIVLFVWLFADNLPFFRNTGHDFRTTVHDAGQDLKATGRDAAASIRGAVQ